MKSIRSNRGFTLMEMSVVLVIIALILGAVTVGRDVYRGAVAERISSEFVQGWILAYDRYASQTGSVPNDGTLTGMIGGGTAATALCSTQLVDEMLKAGVTLPQGAMEGRQDAYIYQDRNGLPQRLQVCLQAISGWHEPSSSTGYVQRTRNVLVLHGLTPELAQQLDQRIDGKVDARAGRVREKRPGTNKVATPTENAAWSRDEMSNATTSMDAASATVTAYIKMSQ